MNPTSNLLDEALGLAAGAPLASRVILVEDRVETSGAFVLHHLIKRCLSPDAPGSSLVLVALAQPFSHYDRILRKSGHNLSSHRENKRMQFVDMLRLEYPDQHKDGLVGLYAAVRKAIDACSSKDGLMIMIDDISILEVASRGSADDVLDFLHYCVALTLELGCSLVMLNHEDVYPSGEAPSLLSNLEYLADVVIRATPLSTGLAADVHGQLTVTRKTFFKGGGGYSPSKISNFHFKVKENGVDYFYPGSRR